MYSGFPAEHEATQIDGLIKDKNSAFEEVLDPWCPALYKSTLGKFLFL